MPLPGVTLERLDCVAILWMHCAIVNVGSVTSNYASVGVDNTISVWNNLGFDTLVFETAAVVPEPATWAMMLVGFGMLGGALRYRGRSSTITYA